LLIGTICLCALAGLDKGLYALLIVSKKQLFVSLNLCSICFNFIDFGPDFDYFLPSYKAIEEISNYQLDSTPKMLWNKK